MLKKVHELNFERVKDYLERNTDQYPSDVMQVIDIILKSDVANQSRQDSKYDIYIVATQGTIQFNISNCQIVSTVPAVSVVVNDEDGLMPLEPLSNSDYSYALDEQEDLNDLFNSFPFQANKINDNVQKIFYCKLENYDIIFHIHFKI